MPLLIALSKITRIKYQVYKWWARRIELLSSHNRRYLNISRRLEAKLKRHSDSTRRFRNIVWYFRTRQRHSKLRISSNTRHFARFDSCLQFRTIDTQSLSRTTGHPRFANNLIWSCPKHSERLFLVRILLGDHLDHVLYLILSYIIFQNLSLKNL